GDLHLLGISETMSPGPDLTHPIIAEMHADTALRRRCPGDEVIVDSPRILEVIAGRQTSLCVIDLRQAPPTVELTGNFVGVGIAEVRIVGGAVVGDVVAGGRGLPVVVE